MAAGQGRVSGLGQEKIQDKVGTVRSHGFRYRGQYEEELAEGELEVGGMPVSEGIRRERGRKGVRPKRHIHKSTSIVTGVPRLRAPNLDGRRQAPTDAGGFPWQS